MIGPRARKDAEAFAVALEGRGPRDSDVQQLVRFAESLCESAVDPSPEFVQSLRADLMADAASVLVATPKTTRTATDRQGVNPARKRIAAATAGALAAAGTLGIVASSAQALPGEMLYPVKRGVESIELKLHRGDAGRGSYLLGQATERLTEAKSLTAESDQRSDELLIESLTAFADTASSGSEDLFADYTTGGNEASIDKVTSFASMSSTTLAALSGQLPPGAQDVFQMAASTVTDLASQASTLCRECDAAELKSLTDMVASFVDDTNKELKAAEKPSPKKATPSLPATTDSTSAPPKLPTVTPPKAPTGQDLKDKTKPIVGALLGDDDQDGLVPGLLGDSAGDE